MTNEAKHASLANALFAIWMNNETEPDFPN